MNKKCKICMVRTWRSSGPQFASLRRGSLRPYVLFISPPYLAALMMQSMPLLRADAGFERQVFSAVPSPPCLSAGRLSLRVIICVCTCTVLDAPLSIGTLNLLLPTGTATFHGDAKPGPAARSHKRKALGKIV
eukprot:GHVU01053240.1.p1 GENE.GHVU01053240.1~~GHVU01053240.1.p1  ORF type:complete len:133 (+),score=6.22 GHVU01053240.1:396-794(+)